MNTDKLQKLKTYAVLSQHSEDGYADIPTGLLLFLEPIVQKLDGKLFNTSDLIQEAKDALSWNLSEDIANEFIPRFEKVQWLVRKENDLESQKDILYLWNYKPLKESQPNLAEQESTAEENLRLLTSEFRAYIAQLSSLVSANRSDDELKEMLLSWLVNNDSFLAAEDIQFNKKIHAASGRKIISLQTPIPTDDTLNINSENSYLPASFIAHLYESESPLFKHVRQIVEIAFLVEIAQSFHIPSSSEMPNLSGHSLKVFIDSPVAMNLLGVSGVAARKNTETLVFALKEIGCSINIFEHSCQEISFNLKAVLSETRAYGPTADAIRRNEVTIDTVKSIQQNPIHALEQLDIRISNETFDKIYKKSPSDFSFEHWDSIYSRLNWHMESLPRKRDTESVAIIQTMRKSFHTPDIFKTKYLFITENSRFYKETQKFMNEFFPHTKNSIPPIILQRQVAMAAWLSTGFSEKNSEIPKAQLLATCEKVLMLRKNVVAKAREILETQEDENKVKEYDLLLSYPRSGRMLMDLTLGSPNALSPENIDEALDRIKRTTAHQIQKEHSAEIIQLNHKHKEETEALQNQLHEKEGVVASFKDKDSRILDAYTKKAETFFKRLYFTLTSTYWLITCIITLFSSGLIDIKSFPHAKWPLLIALIAIATISWTKSAQEFLRDFSKKKALTSLAKKLSKDNFEDLKSQYTFTFFKNSIVRSHHSKNDKDYKPEPLLTLEK